jgi:muramidase (phage lysozyme)
MESSIPGNAARLLDLIGGLEAPNGYDTLFNNNQKNWPNKLTSMTVAEVIDAGPTWTKKFGSSAAGRYQFMNATLKSLRNSEAMTGKEKFDADLQDHLGYALLDRRGYEKFAAGKMSVVDFGLALAQEWAAFPVLEDCQGAHRKVKRGETYYAGDHLNKALLNPEKVEAILKEHPVDFVAAALTAGAAATSGDAERVTKLVENASDPNWCEKVRERGRKAMIRIYGRETSKNACAATLCCFLNAGGIDVPMEYGAGKLARYLEKTRDWTRVKVGDQRAGDVAVCYDKDKRTPGADHIFLVVKRIDQDEMLIADNQTDFSPHTRFASGRRQTAVEYFLRAPAGPDPRPMASANANGGHVPEEHLGRYVVYEDQDTHDLEVRFDENGVALEST